MRNRGSSLGTCAEQEIPGNKCDPQLLLLSLLAAFVGVSAAILAVNFLEGEKVGSAGIVGLAIALRSMMLRKNTGQAYNGWILASSAIPYCALLLPGGLVLLSKRYLKDSDISSACTPLSHEVLASTFPLKGQMNQFNLFALLSSTLAALILITKLQRPTN